MNTHKIFDLFSREKQIAILIDPEKSQSETDLIALIERIHFSKVDFVFVGGSSVSEAEFNFTISILKKQLSIPIVIFPGSSDQVSDKADAILYLSLLSGRNPDFLIGHHIKSAQKLVDSKIEVIPTSYLLIDGGSKSSVAYISQTTPIPRDQESIIKNTALAGKLQGKKMTFLDAGSGAKHPIPESVVHAIRHLNHPIIVGGGITQVEKIDSLHKAGANVVVIGNKIESDIDFLLDIKNYIQQEENR